MLPQPAALTPEAISALVRDAALLARGERLWQQGAVRAMARRGRLLWADVRGSEAQPYPVSAEAPLPGKRRWLWRCTCPYFEIHGGPCKHGVALLLAWAAAPERFLAEPSLDERLAGPERARWLDFLRDTLRDEPTLQRLLALEPERGRPLGRTLNLAPHDEQIRYSLARYRDEPARWPERLSGLLESSAGLLRVGDGANAARLATRLTAALLLAAPTPRPAPLDRFLFETLLLLQAAALEADWPADERAAWLAQVQGWWLAAASDPPLADRLLDLILTAYQPTDEPAVTRWLRALLHRPVQGNRLSHGAWRGRVLAFLLARYRTTGRSAELLELCWEEGEDALAARLLVEQGALGEAERLASQGLGGSRAHRALAAALHQGGEPDAAQRIAEAGLRYHDGGRGALLAWLAARALARGDGAEGRRLAGAAWAEGHDAERYALLKQALQAQGSWGAQRAALHAALVAQGEGATLVEALIEEGAWGEAAPLLPECGLRRLDLTEQVARGLAASEPTHAMALFFVLAALHAEARARPAYARAALALLAAQSIADVEGLATPFASQLASFCADHRRLPALLDELGARGLAPPDAPKGSVAEGA